MTVRFPHLGPKPNSQNRSTISNFQQTHFLYGIYSGEFLVQRLAMCAA